MFSVEVPREVLLENGDRMNTNWKVQYLTERWNSASEAECFSVEESLEDISQ